MILVQGDLARVHIPSHPGEILRALYLEPMGVTITQAAEALGVSRKHVSAIVNSRVPVTPDICLRGAGPGPELVRERALLPACTGSCFTPR